jgi:hypothetical protein
MNMPRVLVVEVIDAARGLTEARRDLQSSMVSLRGNLRLGNRAAKVGVLCEGVEV